MDFDLLLIALPEVIGSGTLIITVSLRTWSTAMQGSNSADGGSNAPKRLGNHAGGHHRI